MHQSLKALRKHKNTPFHFRSDKQESRMAWHFVLDKSACVPLFERETQHYPPWLRDIQRG